MLHVNKKGANQPAKPLLIKGVSSRDNLILLHSNNIGTDQPVHLHFVIHLLESVISRLATCKILITKLVSVAQHVGLSLTWWQAPDRFAQNEIQLELYRTQNLHYLRLWCMLSVLYAVLCDGFDIQFRS